MMFLLNNIYKKLTNASIFQKIFYRLRRLDKLILLLILTLCGIGITMLYSAAKGSFYPWATKQITYFAFSLLLMLFIAISDIRIWYRTAYIGYLFGILLLIVVFVHGYKAMGATRWINLGFIKLQPSEIIKIFLVLALARYFHEKNLNDIFKIRYLIFPILMIAIPFILVIKQPDLGTGLTIIMLAGIIFFAAGVRLWKFAIVLTGIAFTLPIGWQFLHDYQKKRILIFLDPERDPLGSGYNIIQSKIAIGSGGLLGKGFLQGSQGQLNFLPERHTDFIFTMLAEEWGFVGSILVITLYSILVGYSIYVAYNSQSHFGRILSLGIGSVFFLHIFINIAMIMGLIPVVGSPLPLLSYGGTITTTSLIGLGLILNVYLNRRIAINSGMRTLI